MFTVSIVSVVAFGLWLTRENEESGCSSTVERIPCVRKVMDLLPDGVFTSLSFPIYISQ